MNAGMISFLIILGVLFACLVGIIYLIIYIKRKDKDRVIPRESTDEFKKSEKNITNGIIDLHSAKTHQDISTALLLFYSGVSYFREHNLEFEGKRIKDVEKLIEKFSMEKLETVYKDLESELNLDLKSEADELKSKIMSVSSDNIDEYKKIKEEIHQKNEEKKIREAKEKERQKVYNKLIKEDVQAMEKKILDEILRDNNVSLLK